MKTLKLILTMVSISFGMTLHAQIGGNQVYGDGSRVYNSRSSSPIQKNSISSTESAVTIHSRVLLNKVADYYVVYVGVRQHAETVIECNKKINTRIQRLESNLKQLGIGNEDMYVDFISQTKIYDYETGESKAKQYLKGFETKKNVILTLEDVGQIDVVINLCSAEKMYDIIKVEYGDHDLEKIYDLLFQEAFSVIEAKKNRFVKHSSVKLTSHYRITGDNISIFYPKTQYRKYDEAFETSDFSLVDRSHSRNYIKEATRKDHTFYYEGVESTMVFDKIINKGIPKVGIQYILNLTLLYEFEK